MNLVVRDFKGVENLSRYKNVLSESSWIYIYTYEELKDFFLFIILTFSLERIVSKRFVFGHFLFSFLSFFLFFFLFSACTPALLFNFTVVVTRDFRIADARHVAAVSRFRARDLDF